MVQIDCRRSGSAAWMLGLASAMMLLLGPGPASANDSTFSSFRSADCENEVIDEESESGRARCPGVGGYELWIAHGDARSWPMLVHGGQRVEFNELVNAMHRFGAFPGLSSHGVAEWRLDKDGTPLAVIIRMTYADVDSGAEAGSRLATLAINAPLEESCVVGLSILNAEATAVADARERPCLFRDLRW